jgi:hypothetical protein
MGHWDEKTDVGEGSERRISNRVRVPLLVQYRFDDIGEFNTDYALDVSESGLFICTETPHPIGTPVFIQVTTREGELLTGQGHVARDAEGGQGIVLDGFDEAAKTVLARIVGRVQKKGGALQYGPRRAPSISGEGDPEP